MTKAEAHALLDAARAGAAVTRQEIDAALRVTGDLLPLQLYTRVDFPPEQLPSQLPLPEAAPAWQPPAELLQNGHPRVVHLRVQPYARSPS